MQIAAQTRTTAGIAFILVGMVAISINDMLIKALSGGYPLHQIVFTRSAIGLVFSLVLVQAEGGARILRTRHPWLHILRGAMVVVSNMTYFIALAVMPLADATALFFVAPLFITLLSVPILGEKVGPLRIGAVIVGFLGAVIMMRPWESGEGQAVNRVVLALPVVAAFTYAITQVMTRKLGAVTPASALAAYIQGMFVLVSVGFFLVAGDGRFAVGVTDPSLEFLLRAWNWPLTGDWPVMIGLGINSAVIGYCLAQAYRLASAASVAPFEYAELPMAVFWGWFMWGQLPALTVWVGMALIAGSGLFVFLRERQKSRRAPRGEVRGRY